jgi:hypothetical protein
MHIAHKSTSSPQWIWSTFEQVDNLSVSDVAPADGKPSNRKPSLFNPGCEICVPNQPPIFSGGHWAMSPPTQVWRAIPIPADKQALNAEAQAALGQAGSVLRYYQLIDTQWPTQPNVPPTPWTAGLPGAVDNKPGGNPTPVFLTNITMETYFQGGVQPACRQEELPNNVSCPPPPPLAWEGKAVPAGPPADATPIFATESCMGCHSSAGIVTAYDPATKKKTTGGQLTADFSWLFSQKAQWDPAKP